MWHLYKAFGRVTARQGDKNFTSYLKSKLGGEELSSLHAAPGVVGYIHNENWYSHGYYRIKVDGNLLPVRFTRKKDAFQCMTSLKRDYRTIEVINEYIERNGDSETNPSKTE